MNKAYARYSPISESRTGYDIAGMPTPMWVAFFLMHIPLALALGQFSALATLHAIITLAVGFWVAAFGREPVYAVYIAAYITGAEIIWRMNSAGVFWEVGKYAVIGILLITAFRLSPKKGSGLPIIYFVLLLPSVILTVFDTSLDSARDAVSFNLSGPLALAVCAWYFSKTHLSAAEVRAAMLMVVAPAIAVATRAVYTTLTTTSIDFTDESNFITSGGFGPNQVSNILGLGALFAVLYVMQVRERTTLRLVLLGIAIALATVSALTFSRSGIYNAGAALIAYILFTLRNISVLSKVIIPTGIVIGVAALVIVPQLDAFTDGAFSTRYQDTGLSQRAEIAQADIDLWIQNPIAGIGPGQAAVSRAYGSEPLAAHTEFSRLLAEHGLLGMLALAALAIMAVRNIIYARSPADRALIAALQVWMVFFFLNSAMRMVAPSFVFGLATALTKRSDSYDGLIDPLPPEDLNYPISGSRLPADPARAGTYANR